MKLFIKHRSFIFWLMAMILFPFGFYCCSANDKSKEESANKNALSNHAVELKANMRKLWEDHITWTRNVILCLVDELPGTDQAVKRLLQNQTDIGNAIMPFYGEESGKRLTALLNAHINVSAEVVKAAKSGKTEEMNEANKRWHESSDEISQFLNRVNPYLKLTEMNAMMRNHLRLTTEEAVQRINKDYGADVIAYDKVQDEILKMSDMITYGIIKQFPDKFQPEAGKGSLR